MDKNLYAALASAIYVNAMTAHGKAIDTDERRLRAAGLYRRWTPGVHTKGEVYNTAAEEGLTADWEQTWECFADYDNAVYPGIVPGSAAWYTFNRPLHASSAAMARPFVPVQGSHDLYRAGEYALWQDGAVYRCTQDTAHSPADFPAAWEKHT